MTVDTTALRDTVAQKQTGGGKTIRQIVEEQKPQIARALPSVVSPERFTRLVVTELSRNPKLAECSSSSLLGALMYAAGLGVEPGPLGHAYLVPYGKDCTFILGYKGMIELARRSEKLLDIEARTVYEGDHFIAEHGLNPRLEYRPCRRSERGPVVAYYGLARFTNGGHYFDVLYPEDIADARKRSAAKEKGPWVTDFDAMARKTVVRRMAPWLPLSPELATAMEQDEVRATFDPDSTPAEALEIHGPEELPAPEPAPGVESDGDGGGSTTSSSPPPSPDPDREEWPPDPEVVAVMDVAGPDDMEVVRALQERTLDRLSKAELETRCDDAEPPIPHGTRQEMIDRLRAYYERPM